MGPRLRGDDEMKIPGGGEVSAPMRAEPPPTGSTDAVNRCSDSGSPRNHGYEDA